jgi:hypothetical protein
MNTQTDTVNAPADNDNSDRTQILNSWAQRDPFAIIKIER